MIRSLPQISIVTPSFNQGRFIGEALESVRLQNYPNFEHLVVDGFSTDGTVETLRSLEMSGNNKNLTWISELDGGQSEALNKGFLRANGEIIGWLNSDDRYRAGCFEKIIQVFNDNPEVDIVYGDYAIVNETGKILQIRQEIDFNVFILRYHRVLYIATTATFFRKKIFSESNLLNESLHYVMDVDFFLRLAAKKYCFRHVSGILADYRLHPSSKTCSAPLMFRREHTQVILAASPILRRIKSKRAQRLVLSFLRMLAAINRYSRKLLRGYYWKQFCSELIS